jgi:hypothetical protein
MTVAQNPLILDRGRFDEDEISDRLLRTCLNSNLRKMSGINAISTILFNNSIFLESEITEKYLSSVVACGLCAALIELSSSVEQEEERIGLRIAEIIQGKKHG